jgi:hypothetical protein
VVFVEPQGSAYWKEWSEYVRRHLAAPGLISPDDMKLYRITEDASHAVDEIMRFYRIYHSQRYVDDLLVLRLQSELAPSRVEALQSEFSYLVKSGRIEQRGALPEEANQPEMAHLSRLVFRDQRNDFAGLRLLIDRINETDASEARPLAPVGPHPEEERADRGAVPTDPPGGTAADAPDASPAAGAGPGGVPRT